MPLDAPQVYTEREVNSRSESSRAQSLQRGVCSSADLAFTNSLPYVFEYPVRMLCCRGSPGDAWTSARRGRLTSKLTICHALQDVAAVAWDSVKNRLVFMLQGEHPDAGNALLYATVQEPVVSAICLGPLHLLASEPKCADDQTNGARPAGTLAMHTGNSSGTLVAFRTAGGVVSVIPIALRHGPVVTGRSTGSGTQSGTLF